MSRNFRGHKEIMGRKGSNFVREARDLFLVETKVRRKVSAIGKIVSF